MKEQSPDGFPPLTLTIMRALCALTVLYPGEDGQVILCKALDALYKAYWVDHRKTYEKDVLVEVLVESLGEEATGKGMLISISSLCVSLGDREMMIASGERGEC